MRLNAVEARVLGSLMEKRLTTPQQYPLTLPSLVAACNQASNRDPVVAYDEHTVVATLDDLKAQGLLRFVLPSHGRTAMRYRHVLDEVLALDDGQCALLAVLFLRGPQTIGELRIRTDRMAQFDGLAEIEHELVFLGSREEPMAVLLDRRPGQKEQRWVCPLVAVGEGESDASAPVGAESSAATAADGGVVGHPHEVRGPLSEAVDALQADVDSLRSEIADLRRDLHALRTSLGD